MKCLTLTEPFASLVALQKKRIETRSWKTSYRGELAIHAAKGFPGVARRFCEARIVRHALGYTDDVDIRMILNGFHLGCVIATCRLTACVPTEKLLSKPAYAMGMTEQEQAFGNYDEGRWGWMLADIKALPEVVPAKGALGLWEWNP